MQMNKLFAGILIGYLLRMLLLGYVDYAYVARDNECDKNHSNILTCNQFKNAPSIEKILSFQPNVACWTANENLKPVYCGAE
jgi:hypothetical protein